MPQPQPVNLPKVPDCTDPSSPVLSTAVVGLIEENNPDRQEEAQNPGASQSSSTIQTGARPKTSSSTIRPTAGASVGDGGLLPDPTQATNFPSQDDKKQSDVPQGANAERSMTGADILSEAEFLTKLKSGHPFSSTIEPREREEKMFHQLKIMFESKRAQAVYRIEKIDDLIKYKRRANVYLLGMQNKFFCPVWAAACDRRSTGYVMYPSNEKLVCLANAVKDVRNLEDEKVRKRKIRELLRMVAAPVALGLDALHTSNRRPTFYHRDLHIGNVYLPFGKFPSNRGTEDEVFYGDAKICLTGASRCSHDPEFLDSTCSIDNKSYIEQYHLHSEVFAAVNGLCGHQYTKRHDWYSFGVLILELICQLISDDEEIKLDRSISLREQYYIKHVNIIEDFVEKSYPEPAPNPTRSNLLFYLGIARECLDMKQPIGGPCMQYSDDHNTLYFEYCLSQKAAKLVEFYDKTLYNKILADKVRGDTPEEKRIKEICQSCMLRASVNVPTKSYRRGVDRRSGEDYKGSDYSCTRECDRFYCRSCYTNGERLFCPIFKHGTASSGIGHDCSYALIFCGDEFKEPESSPCRDVFVKDGNQLMNTIMHSMICNVSEDNVIFVRLHDDESYGTTPEERFGAALDKMRKLIHGDGDKNACTKDQDYTLMVFYSGHGGKNSSANIPSGAWAPVEDLTMCLTHDHIWKELNKLTKCDGNRKCSESSGLFLCVLDHCYTAQPELKKTVDSDNYKPMNTVVVRTQSAKESFYRKQGVSQLTIWLCMFLRSAFKNNAFPKAAKKCTDDCTVCQAVLDRIKTDCHNAYLDSGCLELHKQHLSKYGFVTKVNTYINKDNIILAHYHPEGILFRIFPLLGDYKEVDIEFTDEINRKNIEDRVRAMLTPELQNARISLLTNHGATNDSPSYSLVWDKELRRLLHLSSHTYDNKPVSPKLMFYQVVNKYVTVRLVMKDERGVEIYDELQLDVEEKYMKKMVNDCNRPKRVEGTLLPNILVHVVHGLFHLHYNHRCDKEGDVSRSPSMSSVGPSSRESQQASLDHSTPLEPTNLTVTEDSTEIAPLTKTAHMIIMETGQDYKYVDNLLLSNHGGMIRIYLKGAGDARITLQPYRKTDGSINSDAYEVIIGKQIALRKKIDGKNVEAATLFKDPSDAEGVRLLWITWGREDANSKLRLKVGLGHNVKSECELECVDPSPLDIGAMAVATAPGVVAAPSLPGHHWTIENIPEKIHTSFAGRLFDTPRYDYKLSNSSEKWLELQNQASRYSLLGRKRLFKAYNSSKDAPYYRIEILRVDQKQEEQGIGDQ